MADKKRLMHRWEDYRASKTFVFWTCIVSIIATIVVGFGWGGWVRGATAQDLATKAADTARAEMASAICVVRLGGDASASAKLALLSGNDSWKRSGFVEEGGWATPPGMAKPISGAASLCAEQLMNVAPRAANAAG
jgi:hypothetical protein